MVPEPRSAYALQFFLLSAGVLAVAGTVSIVLAKFLPGNLMAQPHHFSKAFSVSTGLLFAGSACLYRALEYVRRERQPQFRLWLKLALIAGALFVAVQSYALRCLMRQQQPEDVELGAAPFVALFCALHGMHFIIALLFLCYITVQAMADRYDHEYYWGVTICSWFWHALGMAWVAILSTMIIARSFR